MALKNYKFEYDFKHSVSVELKSAVFRWFLDNEDSFDSMTWTPDKTKVFFHYKGFMFSYQYKRLQNRINSFCGGLDELSF